MEPLTAREVGQPVTDADYFAAVAARLAAAVRLVLQPARAQDETAREEAPSPV